MKIKSGVWGLLALCGLAVGSSAQAALVNAVEYHYSGHYFLTAFPDEIAAIDSGQIPGWKRTGYTFLVQNEATNGYAPVCRFYSTGVARGSHFYTASASECAGLKADPYWKYEADAFFSPAAAGDGTCPTGKSPVYRLYNNRLSGSPNHRFTADANVRADMMAQGWLAEGVSFCTDGAAGSVPADPALAQSMTKKMLGGNWTMSYTYSGSPNVDILTFTTVVSDPASTTAPYYAQGTNHYGLPATARYNLQTGRMEVRSTFVIPATDFFSLMFNTDSAVAGCYYFLSTNATAPTGSCASVTGTRK